MVPDAEVFGEDPTVFDPQESAVPHEAVGDQHDEIAGDELADDLTLPADSDVLAQIRAMRSESTSEEAGHRESAASKLTAQRRSFTATGPSSPRPVETTEAHVPSLIDASAPDNDETTKSLWDPSITLSEPAVSPLLSRRANTRGSTWLRIVSVAVLLSAAIIVAAVWIFDFI